MLFRSVPFTIGVGPNANPKVNIGGLIKICPGDIVKLDAGNFEKYLWSTGDTTSFISVSDSGVYSVLVENSDGCSATDSAEIVVGCGYGIWFPNAFSPDEDGVNDFYRGYAMDVSDYHLILFNRMGQMVFESKEIDKGWNGITNEQLSPIGVYGYVVTYRIAGGDLTKKRGTFTLIR